MPAFALCTAVISITFPFAEREAIIDAAIAETKERFANLKE